MTEPLFAESDFETYLCGESYPALDAAQAVIRAYCGWHVAPVIEETVVVDGGWVGDKLFLPSLHVLEVSDVTVNGDEAVDLTTVEVSQSGYLRRFGSWWYTYDLRNVSVTMTHGYADVPANLLTVLYALAGRAQASPTGATTEQVGPFRVSYATNSDGSSGGVLLSALERTVLDEYKICRMA